MKQTIRLGRVAGIPVGVHWSVLVIAALLTQGLAMSFLPASARRGGVHGPAGKPPLAVVDGGVLVGTLDAADISRTAELVALGVPVDLSRRPPAPGDGTGRNRHVDSLMS